MALVSGHPQRDLASAPTVYDYYDFVEIPRTKPIASSRSDGPRPRRILGRPFARPPPPRVSRPRPKQPPPPRAFGGSPNYQFSSSEAFPPQIRPQLRPQSQFEREVPLPFREDRYEEPAFGNNRPTKFRRPVAFIEDEPVVYSKPPVKRFQESRRPIYVPDKYRERHEQNYQAERPPVYRPSGSSSRLPPSYKQSKPTYHDQYEDVPIYEESPAIYEELPFYEEEEVAQYDERPQYDDSLQHENSPKYERDHPQHEHKKYEQEHPEYEQEQPEYDQNPEYDQERLKFEQEHAKYEQEHAKYEQERPRPSYHQEQGQYEPNPTQYGKDSPQYEDHQREEAPLAYEEATRKERPRPHVNNYVPEFTKQKASEESVKEKRQALGHDGHFDAAGNQVRINLCISVLLFLSVNIIDCT